MCSVHWVRIDRARSTRRVKQDWKGFTDAAVLEEGEMHAVSSPSEIRTSIL